MKNKGLIRNICVDVILQTLLIARLFNMENTIINNACKFLPVLFSLLLVITFITTVSFIVASGEPIIKAKILNDKSFIDGFLEIENNKKIKIYHNITNCSLAGLLILNGFIGSLGVYLSALLLLTYSKQCLRMLINLPPKPDPQAFEKFKKKLLQETSVN